MKYQYLLFDADNTLFDFTASEKDAITKTFLRFGIDCAHIERYSQINDALWKELEKGNITRNELKEKRFSQLLKEIGVQKDAKAISDFYCESLSNESILFDDAVPVVSALFRKGYTICIITNGIESIQTKRFERSKIVPYVKKIYISDTLGVSKPDSRFFDIVLSDLEAKKEECLIIGDSLTSDILGGQNSEIDTCWLNLNNQVSSAPTYTITNLNEILDILE